MENKKIDNNFEKDNNSKKADVKRAFRVIEDSDKMSSKFAEVGRNIVLALIAGSWLLLYRFQYRNPTFIELALVCAFIYLLIDLIYYCYTMIRYWAFVKFDKEELTYYIKDNRKRFIKQANIKTWFMILSVIKTIILFLSILFICLFITISKDTSSSNSNNTGTSKNVKTEMVNNNNK